MPQIIAWQCATTKKVFTEKSVYIAHLRKIAGQKRKELANELIRTGFSPWLATEKESIVSVSMIVPWLLKNQRTIMDAISVIPGLTSWSHDHKFFDSDVFTHIVTDLTYSRNVSNSHSNPVNGVRNWCARNPDLPTGYPGWYGRIGGSLSRSRRNDTNYPAGDFFQAVGIHTGTGGGGNNSFGWAVTMFEADWPNLSQEQTIMVLRSK